MPPTDDADLELYRGGLIARLTNVDAGYQSDLVLQRVQFEARAGEAALISGPTSAGKTTLMNVLRLALPPKRGRALMLGEDGVRMSDNARARLKRRIGYVSENPSFVEHWSATDNIALPLKLAGQRPQDFQDDVADLVRFVGLGAAADEPAGQLSAAARRLAAIARALATKPQLILADDPTSGMSPEAGRRVVHLLMEMRRVGAAVVIASQDDTLVDVGPLRHWRIERGRISPAETHEDYSAYPEEDFGGEAEIEA